jgi:hypothetical protein
MELGPLGVWLNRLCDNKLLQTADSGATAPDFHRLPERLDDPER